MEQSQKLFWTIKETAEVQRESVWTTKMKLRAGLYRAVKDGRRTKVLPESVLEYNAGLPVATFAPPTRGSTTPADKSLPHVKRHYRRRHMIGA